MEKEINPYFSIKFDKQNINNMIVLTHRLMNNRNTLVDFVILYWSNPDVEQSKE